MEEAAFPGCRDNPFRWCVVCGTDRASLYHRDGRLLAASEAWIAPRGVA